MANSKKARVINVSHSTYERLAALKQGNDTFNDVVTKILDLEDKYNQKDESIEFEYVTPTNLKMFKVVYSENETQIFYYNVAKKRFEKSIKAWDTYLSISKEEKDEFLKFILNENNQVLLRFMGEELSYGNFIIHKVGNI